MNENFHDDNATNNTYDWAIDDDYGSDDPHSIFDWNELAPTLIVYGLTFILGLTGNILIIFTTFKYRRMKSVTNVFLSSLASSDLLLIIFCIPVKVAKLFSYTWQMGMVVCKGVHYMQNVSAICSVLTLTAISLERYIAIVYPYRAKSICTISQAKTIIIVIWILSFILGTPTLVAQIHLPVGVHEEHRWCVRDWDNKQLFKFHEVYMLVVILVGPFLIMTFSYTIICWKIWRHVMNSEQSLSKKYTSIPSNDKFHHNYLNEDKNVNMKNGGKDDVHMVKQVICMLVIVVVLFAICWAPLLIDNVLMAFGVVPVTYDRFGGLKYMTSAFHLMAYFNSCINPIIYGFMSKNFREAFVMAVCFSSDIKFSQRGSSYTLKQLPRRGSQSHTRSTSIIK